MMQLEEKKYLDLDLKDQKKQKDFLTLTWEAVLFGILGVIQFQLLHILLPRYMVIKILIQKY